MNRPFSSTGTGTSAVLKYFFSGTGLVLAYKVLVLVLVLEPSVLVLVLVTKYLLPKKISSLVEMLKV